MASSTFLVIIAAYFLLLLGLAWYTGRASDNESFFIGNRKSNWMLVAFGMVGTMLSGVTFISVPGTVGANGFAYFQVVIGNWIGFMLVALVLLPLYYRERLTSLYDYLGNRFGPAARKTGAAFFILSRVLGATARLYLVVNVLHLLIGEHAGMPFALTAGIILLMIWLYTFQGGVKTIVFTDTLQTACMLGGLAVCVIYLANSMEGNIGARLAASHLTQVWNTDPNAAGFWLKQVLGGVFIALVMTGLDQEMMQKNISVPRLADSQKNIFCSSLVLLLVNGLFLLLGALLTLFAQAHQLPAGGDELFPMVVMRYFPAWVQIIFFVALISALFPSADGALTALTSSFCIDILGIRSRTDWSDATARRVRQVTHVAFALLFFAVVMGFKWLDDKSVIDTILKLAGYTYGPLLGLFAFGMFTHRSLPKVAGVVGGAVAAPLICFALAQWLAQRPQGYQLGIELLVINGALTFLLLWAASAPPTREES